MLVIKVYDGVGQFVLVQVQLCEGDALPGSLDRGNVNISLYTGNIIVIIMLYMYSTCMHESESVVCVECILIYNENIIGGVPRQVLARRGVVHSGAGPPPPPSQTRGDSSYAP